MATTITGKLNKAANQFQAGESTGFGIRLGVKYRDPKTKQDEWTNYSAVIFAKAPGQVQFYQSALVEDSIVEVTCDQLKIDSFDGKNGPVLSIDMLNARLGYVYSQQQVNAPQMNNGGFQQAPQQQGYQSQPNPTYQQATPQQQQQQPPRFISQDQQQSANNNFDDDIAF